VPNQLNLNYFFDGINPRAKNRVHAFKVTRFGEIWCCYPRGDATECTHAVIYNVRENTWYDTELPNGGRSASNFNNGLAAPLLTGATINSPSNSVAGFPGTVGTLTAPRYSEAN
jgi:hypothetical protein